MGEGAQGVRSQPDLFDHTPAGGIDPPKLLRQALLPQLGNREPDGASPDGGKSRFAQSE